MCGIAGIYTPGCDIDAELPARMAAALSHRGPDGQGMFAEQGVALIHTRLSIIDLEHGQQPLYSQDRQRVLVATGHVAAPALRATEGVGDSFPGFHVTHI